MGEDTLASGWTWTTLEEIALALNPGFPSGKHNKNQQGVPHLRPMNISAQGSVDFSEVKYVEVSDYDPLLKGDVLFNNTNSPALLGKTSYIRQDTRWAYSNHMTRIRFYSGTVNSAFIAYYLHHLFLSGFFRLHCTHHVNQASINTSFLSKVSIPFPPLPEQHRIVAEIEKQLTRLDAGVTALRRAQAKLRRYKAAVLKAACEGRLVPQDPADEPASALLQRILAERRKRWEAEQIARGKDAKKQKYKEPAPPDTSEVPELPEGWVWASLEQLSWDSGYGTSQKCDYDASGPPVLRIPNVSGGRLDFSDMKYAIKADELTTEKAVAEGDILIIRTNGSRDLIGRSALVRQSFEKPYFFASYLIRFRIVDTSNIGVWLATAWDSQAVRRQIERMAATTAGQYNINITKLNRLELPIPPSAEQQRIITEVERRLSVVEELEAAVEANLKRAERLRQAVLKRAFEGKLVPQDPSDEPASLLLERIRAAREKRGAKGKGKRKATRGRKRERDPESGEQLRLL